METRGIDRLLSLQTENAERGERFAALAPRFLQLAQRHELGTAPKAVTGFNLFQTPRPIAALMAAKIRERAGEGAHILEPSAGLGRLVDPLADLRARWLLIEEAHECCNALKRSLSKLDIRERDFLAVGSEEVGTFDAVVMNPPFKQGRDVKHIMHALDLLKPGGRLVSLCYNGVRQNEVLRPLADEWEVLPEKSFREEGTGASVAMLVIDKPEQI